MSHWMASNKFLLRNEIVSISSQPLSSSRAQVWTDVRGNVDRRKLQISNYVRMYICNKFSFKYFVSCAQSV